MIEQSTNKCKAGGCGECPLCRARRGEVGIGVVAYKDGKMMTAYDVNTHSDAVKASAYLYAKGADDVIITIFMPHPEKAAMVEARYAVKN